MQLDYEDFFCYIVREDGLSTRCSATVYVPNMQKDARPGVFPPQTKLEYILAECDSSIPYGQTRIKLFLRRDCDSILAQEGCESMVKVKTGQTAPVSGQYKPKGSNREVTMIKGKRVPPTPEGAAEFRLVDVTKHKR